MEKMHLKIVEETEWDAAGELVYVIQAAQNMIIFNVNILIYKCHRFTRAIPFLHKGPSWQPVLSLKYRMSAGRERARASDRRNTEEDN